MASDVESDDPSLDCLQFVQRCRMGMFDYYEPLAIICPYCAAGLSGWQGKDANCGLYVWRQTELRPVDQRVDDEVRLHLTRIEYLDIRLPQVFGIYTECANCLRRIFAEGHCDASGRWTETTLGHGQRAKHLRKGEPDYTVADATPLGDGWRMCILCTAAWEWPEEVVVAACPRCERLTAVRTEDDTTDG